ncbi:sulfite oxidase-like oxidoreductase [Caulobacter endophyticus]|uniref:Sulfite oxidase-like oxidoreductase n=1 Tax=Caulobacter endophyticus TaxID=2172652 RepID=A0A2T9JQ70_9CAUL|nr:sulfite oxidase-like oxidoreductase [Caulobacter endophyticus]PVM85849.1 sulfite oxidase-like oxidoreductase [Caulobacter endophyticus]
MDDDQPPQDSKLTRSKEAWARSGKFLTGDRSRPEAERLPPGQHLTSDWPVLDLGLKPDVSREDWRLRIDGLVSRPATWSFSALLAQPQSAPVSDIHCVTTWSRYDNHWHGVLTRDVVLAVAPRDEARFVVLHSYDGYTTNLALDDFAHEGALLAHGWEGAPIAPEHGGPVRLVVPHLYFWKSAKWLKRVEFVAADRPGFWEERGYHNRGDPWGEERYG